ncbi:EAL domain-containing response regulator [Halomonas denitrificans]|nr:EAL domain-containing response regulator [Halomonas denitrificans]
MPERRVLILDDDAGAAEALGFMLESLGAQPRVAQDAEAFFGTIREWSPDIVCLDLVMPRVDGVEVIHRLAEEGFDAGIIISSGVGSRVLDAARRAAVEHGLRVVGTLPKPFALSRLKELLHRSTPHGPSVSSEDSEGREWSDADLRNAVAEQQIRLVYQPKFRCRNREVRGFEALARWHHPEHGIIAPDAFVPALEQAGLMGEMTQQVLREAFCWLDALNRSAARSGDPYTVAVNLSAAALRSADFVEDVWGLCSECGIEPQLITLELTETAAMEDAKQALALLTRLRMKGFHVAIDDFGTGYSSMAQLSRLPFDEIKIDKSFVVPALESRDSQAIIKSTVDLGRSLGLRVVAEGVEDEATLDYLNEIGCDQAQGYLVAAPMPGEEVLDWLRGTSRSR